MTAHEQFSIIGVFVAPDAAERAAGELRDLGVQALEAYTPYPVEGLGEGRHSGRRVVLPLVVLAAALIGLAWGYFVQYWAAVLDYPLDVGGRPYHSWPAFIVTTVETAALFAIAAAFFGLLAACRLPLLYHPIFEAAGFERASRDRFVLSVAVHDPGFQPDLIRNVFERHGAERIAEVAAWR